MALTLDATLATAQDSQDRKPLVGITSTQLEADIPFDGQDLTTGTTDSGSASITHSSGRILTAYISGDNIKYVYTDVNREEFNTITFSVTTDSLRYLAMTELVNGDIGILYIHSTTFTTYYRYKTLSVTGTQIADGLIESWATSLWIDGLSVIKLANDTYLAVTSAFVDPDYLLHKRTSSDFTSWSASSALSIAGITTTLKTRSPFLIQEPTGDLFLWFEHVDALGDNDEELINIYYSISADNGATWGTAVKVTTYTEYTSVGKHPVAVQKTPTSMIMAYYKQSGALWLGSPEIGTDIGFSWIGDMHFDPTTRKLHLIITNYSGIKDLTEVVQVDVDTWTVDKTWNCASIPNFSTIYCGQDRHVWSDSWRGDGIYTIMGTGSASGATDHFAILNTDSDTITQYNFHDNATYSLVKNIDWTPISNLDGDKLVYGHVDAANDKIWLAFENSYLYSMIMHIGYIALSDTGPTYTFTPVVEYSTWDEGYSWDEGIPSCMQIVPDDDIILFTMQLSSGSSGGSLIVYNISSEAIWKSYRWSDFPDFPYNGIWEFVYSNGYVYGTFAYEGIPSEENKRGLCIVNLATNLITYSRPSFATRDDYSFGRPIALDDGRILIPGAYGVALYNPSDTSWRVYDNTTVPGLTPSGYDTFFGVIYDESKEMIFAATYNSTGDEGLAGFLVDGYIQQTHYIVGTYTTSWLFGAETALVYGIRDYEISIALDPDDSSMYVFWTRETTAGTSIMWDKETTDLDVLDYLTNDEISIHWDITGAPNTLDFTVGKGHLFDPHNVSSLYSIYFKKGRGLSLKFGENINDVEYWQTQGDFLVTQTNLSYARGEYPVMKIHAEDKRHLWAQNNVVATEYYDTTPDIVIDDILTTHMGMVSADINLPTFDDEFDIEHQWLDTSVNEIVTEIANRFRYFMHMEVNGDVTARKIDAEAATDHTYPDNSKISRYTPDDSFSSFVNRIIVTGQEKDYIEILFNEELVGQESGTIGWWGFDKDFDIYYSKDLSKKCSNPRLYWKDEVHPAHSVLAWYGSVESGISYIDPEDRYCTVEIKAPNLLPALLAAVVGYFTANKIGDITPPFLGGYTIPLGRWLESGFLLTAFYILGSVTNYQFEVHANPKGNVRRSIQGQADDTDLQIKVGVIEEKIDGTPFCYTIAECVKVAEFELLIEQLQRNRLKFDKVAHLQDEIGDTVIFKHPYTDDDLKCFITSLTRRFKKSSASSNDGYFIDNIEAWKL